MTIDMTAWANADANAVPDDNPPADGLHQGVQVTSEFFQKQSDGTPFVRTTYKLESQAGTHRWTSLHGFGSPGAIGATKGHVASLGVNVDQVASTEALQWAVGQVALIATVRVKRAPNPKNPDSPFVNTYVQGGQQAQVAPQAVPGMPQAPAPAPPAAPVAPPAPPAQGGLPLPNVAQPQAQAPTTGIDPDIPF